MPKPPNPPPMAMNSKKISFELSQIPKLLLLKLTNAGVSKLVIIYFFFI